MELPHADQAALLATLSCVILPLLTFVIYTCLKPRRKTSEQTAKSLEVHAAAPPRKTARETATTYRIQGISLAWDETQLQAFLDRNGAKLTVESLALDIEGDEKIATGTFHGPRPSNPPKVPELDLDDHFHGMTTLYAPSPEDHKIDIVAISGLGGHAFGSFKAKSSADFMWLRDRLPRDIVGEETKRPMARIMTYGYNSDVANSDSLDDLQTLATKFSVSLLALAETPTPKPLVFIAHSLGGLIVKKATIQMSQSKKERTARLYQAIYGFVFFGVPNDGMNIEYLKPMVGDGPNRGLVESLNSINSMTTEEASHNFHSGLGGQGESEVFCFYETLKSPVPEETSPGRYKMSDSPIDFIVTRSSATRYCRRWESGMDHECGIAKNHSNLVKFDRHDNEYKNVRQKLREIAERARVREPRIDANLASEARRKFKELRDKIKFPAMNSKYAKLSGVRAQGTCQWLLESDGFQRWKAEFPQGDNTAARVLLLTGKPGCGKSVLMRTAVESASQDAPANHVVVHFFFDVGSNPEDPNCSGAGFYRAMLCQLLEKMDLDIRALLKLHEALPESIYDDTCAPNLRGAILQTLQHMQATEITVFLDGLDDCTHGSHKERSDVFSVLEFLTELPSIGAGVRVCLSARSQTFLGDVVKPTYVAYVDKSNGDDIWTFLQGQLTGEAMLKRPYFRKNVLRRVHARASNTFLWVRLVVAKIEQKMSGRSDEYIFGLVDSEPSDLFELYASLLSHVEAEDRAKIQKEAEALLQLVQVAARGLTVEEAGWLLKFESGEKNEPRDLESHIAFVSCGLVECRLDASDPDQPRQVIQFIHESVADFVLGKQNTLFSNPDTVAAAQARFHFNAFRMCSRVIQWSIDYSKRKPPPMLPYAAQFWMLHARKGEAAMADAPAEQYDEFVMQCSRGSKQAAAWYTEHLGSGASAYLAMANADIPNRRFVRDEKCLLVLLASEGCTRLADQHLRGGCDCCRSAPDAGDDDDDAALQTLRRAVFLAVRRGYADTVRVLLGAAADGVRGGAAAVVNAHYQGRETALWWACSRGYEAVVRELLARGADAGLEARGHSPGLPLHAAAALRCLGVVRLLLRPRRGRLVPALLAQRDRRGWTALHVAVQHGAVDVLEELLGAAADAGLPPLPLLTDGAGAGISPYDLCFEKMHEAHEADEAAKTETFALMVEEMHTYFPDDWKEDDSSDDGSGDDGSEDEGPMHDDSGMTSPMETEEPK